VIPLLFAACSFSRFEYSRCATNAECRDAFGFGSVCGEEGLCRDLEPDPRCTSAPVDLFERLEEHRDDIVIGSLFDHSSDIPEIHSAALAVDQVNQAEGLVGHDYAIVQCSYEENPSLDSMSMDEATAAVATWLADEAGVPAIVGPATSSQSEVAYATLNSEQAFETLIVSPSATSPALIDIDGLEKSDEHPGLFWRTAPPDSLQGLVIAEDIQGRGSDEVAVIYETGPYGEGLAVAFSEAFEAAGGAYSLLPFSDDGQRTEAVTTGGEARYDEVVFISGEITDIVAFMESAGANAGYTDRPVFLTDGARDVALLTDVESPGGRALFAFVRGTAPATPSGPNYDTFRGSYNAAYSGDATDSVYTSYTYDATWLALYGSAWAWYQGAPATAQDRPPERQIGGPDSARGLRRLSDGDPVVIRTTSWPDVLSHFEAGIGVNIDGASGHLDFDPDTEETTAPIDIWVVSAGAEGFETEYTVEP
jgi:branched-chain amino acid transport system substrate-binding protein